MKFKTRDENQNEKSIDGFQVEVSINYFDGGYH